MFTTLQSTQLLEAVKLLKLAYHNLDKLIDIKVLKQTSDNKQVEYKFSYFSDFNSWSHQVSLIATEEGVYLKSYRMDRKQDLTPFIYTTYAHGQVGYRIPINEPQLIVKCLTEYDNFTYK